MATKNNSNVIPLFPRRQEWVLRYTHYGPEGAEAHTIYIFNYDQGLTAREAYAIADFPHKPAFHQVLCDPLIHEPSNTRIKAR